MAGRLIGEQYRGLCNERPSDSDSLLLTAGEPTGNLDAVTGERIIELLFELNRGAQTTLVMVTHDIAIAQRCGRTVRIEAGRLSE